jgi:hypothetical protein
MAADRPALAHNRSVLRALPVGKKAHHVFAALMIPVLGITVAACGNSDVKRQDANSPTTAVAGAAQDFWVGAENRDATRFCSAIVGRAGHKLVRMDAASCADDLRSGAFAGISGGGHFERVIHVSIRGTTATALVRFRAGTHPRDAEMDLVHVFGRWRVPLPAPN